MVYRSNRDGRGCVWLQDFETGKKTEHCTDAVNTLPPYISPGGKRAFYWAGRTVLVMDAGGGKEQFICRRCRPGPWLADEQRLLIQYNDGRVAVKDPGDPEGRDVLRSGKRKLEDPEPSPDARWIAFHTTDRRGAQIFVAPFRHTEPVLEKDWIPITDASAIDRNAHWSPGGNLLYFLSDRDGMRCIWAQRIDPRTGRPRGAAFPVHHFHHARLSLTQGANPSDVSMSVAKDRLVVSIVENTGNIWILGAER
jgi:Tol biopolymer transport system component